MKNKILNEDLMELIENHYRENFGVVIYENIFDSLKIVDSIKLLLNKHYKNNNTNYKLLVNHIIVLSNIFGQKLTCIILIKQLDKKLHSGIVAILSLLEFFPDNISVLIPEDTELKLKVQKEISEN